MAEKYNWMKMHEIWILLYEKISFKKDCNGKKL